MTVDSNESRRSRPAIKTEPAVRFAVACLQAAVWTNGHAVAWKSSRSSTRKRAAVTKFENYFFFLDAHLQIYTRCTRPVKVTDTWMFRHLHC